jgi:serine/threonine protein kinase
MSLAAEPLPPTGMQKQTPEPPQTANELNRAKIMPQDAALSGALGRFQIRTLLGQGAFGTVYRAFDPLDREVALKTPRLGADGAERAERLILEAKSAARLRHPHIVAVYEAGAAGDDLFVACEFVEGQTLADRMQRERVELAQAVGWVRSLAEALAYAHEQGVVHRDVKPHNVMINADGRAMLMDFGLATRDAAADAFVGWDESASPTTPADPAPSPQPSHSAAGGEGRVRGAGDERSAVRSVSSSESTTPRHTWRPNRQRANPRPWGRPASANS